ncbi:MAG TPA: hypothetical protein VK993_00370 [Chthoniobacterales bacterium]|nr:hypothetical protein [Chthoniobacterales bacterium]
MDEPLTSARFSGMYRLWYPDGRDERTFARLRAIVRGERVRGENDLRISATYRPDLVHAILDLLVDGESGVWHLANTGAMTPEQFLIAAADIADLDVDRIDGSPTLRLNRAALHPRDHVLQSERGSSCRRWKMRFSVIAGRYPTSTNRWSRWQRPHRRDALLHIRVCKRRRFIVRMRTRSSR